MAFKIFLFETSRGEKPVRSFISSCSFPTKAKIAHLIDLLENFGNSLGMPHSKKIGNNLYELRVRGQIEIRIFYTFKNNSICLLHAFQKKTERTPAKEINLAVKRKNLL